jgi:hypothetical protein
MSMATSAAHSAHWRGIGMMEPVATQMTWAVSSARYPKMRPKSATVDCLHSRTHRTRTILLKKRRRKINELFTITLIIAIIYNWTKGMNEGIGSRNKLPTRLWSSGRRTSCRRRTIQCSKSSPRGAAKQHALPSLQQIYTKIYLHVCVSLSLYRHTHKRLYMVYVYLSNKLSPSFLFIPRSVLPLSFLFSIIIGTTNNSFQHEFNQM